MLQQQTRIFFPNLDGLRFIAFFVVFINHAAGCLAYKNGNTYYTFIRERFLLGGDLGVNLFFVLSGFLITFLLLKEKELYGRVNVPHFYMRRILRIWPVYFLVVLICLFIIPSFREHIPESFPISSDTDTLNPWLYVSFLGNFDYLYHGISNVLIGVLWSVSVEEQFYLFWPLIIAFIPRNYLMPTFILLILASVAFRFFCSNGGSAMIIRYHSFSSMSDLATGALLAYLCTKDSFIKKAQEMPRWLIVFCYLLFFAIIPFRSLIWKFGLHYVHVASVLPLLISVFFAFFIFEQNYAKNSFYKLSKFPLISSLGKYTYGMYCYHMLVFFLVLYIFYRSGVNVSHVNKYIFTLEVLLAFAGTIFFSKLSYHYFESHFLKLKKRFASIIK
jgi:peptidoglycan/LPS O-acetylase OafA/YrhL